MTRLVRHVRALSCAGVLASLATGSCSTSVPARDEVVVVIDTDAPVPSWVDRLQVQVFDASGRSLLDSRDYAMPDPANWPLSFGVHPARADEAIDVRLRVRAYNSSRPASAFSPIGDAGAIGSPTPEASDPVSTIDRAVRIATTPGVGVVQTRITLHADCFGVPSDVVAGSTCVDAPGQSSPVPVAAVGAFPAETPASAVGSWAAARQVDCAATPRAESGVYDEELCIPGGVFIMGDVREEHAVPDSGNLLEVPERIFQLSPFLLDWYEVSVGRFRAAMNDPVSPFVPPTEPTQPDGPIDCSSTTVNYRFCTWNGKTAAPDATADALPVNCIDAETAEAFCKWAGGDLASEAEWEYAATKAFRDVKTFLPWGSAGLSCDVASYGRWLVEEDTGECGHDTLCGPLPVNAPFGGGPAPADCTGFACTRDETPGPPGQAGQAGQGGIVGMGGNVAEWVRDANDPFDAPCWQSASRLDPVCVDPSATTTMFRGGMWMTAAFLVYSELRTGGIAENPLLATFGGVGFRCMRPGRGGAP